MTHHDHMPIEQAALDAAAAAAQADADELDQAHDALAGTLVRSTAGGAQVATRFSDRIEQLLKPYTLDLDEWAEALFDVREFPESDPDEQSTTLLASILLAESSEEALAAMQLDRAKLLAGDEPGGHSPLLTIHGARPIRSEYEEGPSCYIIVDYTRKVDGKRGRFTTGARAVQAVILAHIGRGWMPFDAILEIRSQKTRRGYYPLNLVAGG